jgi:hypothetical protein
MSVLGANLESEGIKEEGLFLLSWLVADEDICMLRLLRAVFSA